MSAARRTLAACVLALACAVAVFALPGLAWSSVRTAVGRVPAQDTASAPPAAMPAQDAPAGAVAPAGPAVEPFTTPGPLPPRPLGTRLRGLLGLVALLGIAVALSSNRRRISWRVLAWGLGLQAVFAVFVLRVPLGQRIFREVGTAVSWLLHFSYEGSQFVFGELGAPNSKLGFIFAFQVLPAIIFVSALFAIMYYLGVMQLVVRAFAVVMNRVMGASGAESLNVAASIFMGQTEAPLTIRPFLPRMTRSELMTVMTAGMAHVSGSIMAAYIAFGIEARHLLTAVIMTAPGTIMMAKILEPETDTPETMGGVKVDVPRTDVNVLDAAARGTSEGLQLMLNVLAMLVSVIALVALLNGLLGFLHQYVAWAPASLQQILGVLFWPVAWLMGVPVQDTGTIASLLGTRMVLNEFIAFAELGTLKAALDPVSFTIATFALCGFANLSSIGIQIGGIGALAPERKPDLARLGLRAMIAGTLANFVSATLAAMLL